MEINEKYQVLAAEIATKLELKEHYESLGYSVCEEYRIGEFLFDLYVEKEDSKIAFEFKRRDNHFSSRNRFEEIRKYLQEQGIRFKVVIVPRPVKRQIEVDGIEQTIFESFLLDMPSELDELSTHTIPQEVNEVSINSITLRDYGYVEIAGSSEIIVELGYGSRSDDVTFTDSYPFAFKGVWKYENDGKLKLQELTELEFDTSSFNE